MFRLTREVRFAVNYSSDDQDERPPSNSYAGYPSLNGLGYFLVLRATIAGEVEARSSYLANIKDIDRKLRENAIPRFADTIRRTPQRFGASELAALSLDMQDAWRPAALESLSLGLSPFLWMTCLLEEHPMTRLSQMFEFSASHRLHNPALSEEQNRQTFGKCNNPHGHGHNYQLQVTLAGTPDSNGLLVDVPAFERVVKEAVIDRFDHKNLNVEVGEFAGMIPSVENIARVIYGVLKPRMQGARTRLASVTVWETPKTWCEYSEE
jgi:6-pyruvoyltetrahydropterin/6-carboxytetrahydropterin synthase